MREAHPLEREVGIGYYASETPGTGGRLRHSPEDFRVRELEVIRPEPPNADPDAYPYLVLRVRLRDWDTTAFAGALSDRLGVSRRRIDWAGTKDKRADTTQLFSLRAHDIEPTTLPTIADANIEVIGRLGRPLQYGDLAGNAFHIVVRDASAPGRAESIMVELRADDANNEGQSVLVPNYFGHQRFGSRRAITHRVGLEILRRDWRAAVLVYAGAPSDREPADARQARELVEREAASTDPDWGSALAAMPDRLGHERTLLQGLRAADPDTDPGRAARDALDRLPRNLQQLFVHAAQSYVFNRIVTRRLTADLPLAIPVAGDGVCFGERIEPTGPPSRTGEDAIVVPDTDRRQRIDEARLETVTRHCRRGRAFVTAPLVGTETAFATGEPGRIERAVCEAVGIEPADFDLPEPYDTTGTVRPIAVRTHLALQDPDEEPQYTLRFALPKGAYASVLAREYLKVSPEQL